MGIIDEFKVLLGILDYNTKVNRLKKIYPEANTFVRASWLFGDEEYENRLIAAKKDKKRAIFYDSGEEKGIVKTSIIPIFYCGLYRRGVAKLIAEEIEKYKEFFAVFLSEWDSINLTDEQVAGNSLQINYSNIRIPQPKDDIIINCSTIIKKEDLLYMFEDSVLYKYRNSRALMNRIKKDSRKQNQWRTVTGEMLLDEIKYLNGEKPYSNIEELVILNEDYEFLKELLEKGVTKEFVRRYIKERSFDCLNYAIEKNIPNFLQRNISLIKKSIDFSFSEFDHFPISNIQSRYFTNDKITELVIQVLESLSSGQMNFVDCFLNGIQEGEILLFNLDEKDEVIRKLKNDFPYMQTEKIERLTDEAMYVRLRNKHRVIVPLKNSINDVGTIVHEFFHYYLRLSINHQYLSEVISIYFQYYAGMFLINSRIF